MRAYAYLSGSLNSVAKNSAQKGLHESKESHYGGVTKKEYPISISS